MTTRQWHLTRGRHLDGGTGTLAGDGLADPSPAGPAPGAWA